MRVLLAESDATFAAEVRLALRSDTLIVELATDAVDVIERAMAVPYEALILDLAFPGARGASLITCLRRNGVTAPILALAADCRPEARIEALHAGADDCVTRPILIAELAARVHALTRRAGRKAGDVLEVEDLVLHRAKREAFRGGRALALTDREFTALEYLVRARGKPVPATELLELLWHEERVPQDNFIAVLMMRLRKKVDTGSKVKLVRTIRGTGYVVMAPEA